MRHLKTYRLFENRTDLENAILDIGDICLEFEDSDIISKFDVSMKTKSFFGVPGYDKGNDIPTFMIYLRDKSNRFFKLKDIEDVLDRINDYLTNLDLDIDLEMVIEIGFPYQGNDIPLSLEQFKSQMSSEEFYRLCILIYDKKMIQ